MGGSGGGGGGLGADGGDGKMHINKNLLRFVS